MSELDLQPTLVGSTITLRPLQSDDFEALYRAASDPAIWEQHPDSTRYQRDIFQERYFTSAIESGGALAVYHNQTGRIIGSSRFYEWNPDTREITIGYTFLEKKYWGAGTNPEMKKLMLDHAFIQARIAWFHIAKKNQRSRRAIERLGAVLSHEEERDLDGESYVQLYYKLPATRQD